MRVLLGFLIYVLVDWADVVQTAASNEVARGSVGAGHDPGGPQGDGVHLVGRVRVPHDQLAVLGGRHQVSGVSAPVHCVHLDKSACYVSSKSSSRKALTLDKCPLNVLLVLIWILPMASMLTVAWDRLVSHAAFLPSLMEFLRCSASCLSCSSSFILAVVCSGRCVS